MPGAGAGAGRRGNSSSSRRTGVEFSKPQEPSFLRKLKDQVGYVSQEDSINAKFRGDNSGAGEDEDGGEDRDDERPTVVVLKPGDLTEEEAAKLEEEEDRLKKVVDEEEGLLADCRIKFKKPVKRSPSGNSSAEEGQEASRKRSKTSYKSAVCDRKLLSFGQEEDDDD